jgi:hypothetical protein
MGQELLYKVTKGDITKDAYWEMMNRIIEFPLGSFTIVNLIMRMSQR